MVAALKMEADAEVVKKNLKRDPKWEKERLSAAPRDIPLFVHSS